MTEQIYQRPIRERATAALLRDDYSGYLFLSNEVENSRRKLAEMEETIEREQRLLRDKERRKQEKRLYGGIN